MSEVIDLVPEDGIQAERTAGMFQMVNENHDRKAREDEQAHMAGQARFKELEMQEQRRMAEVQRMFWTAFCWAAGCSALVILAHTGAIAGWVMHIGTTVLSFLLGLVCGRMAG